MPTAFEVTMPHSTCAFLLVGCPFVEQLKSWEAGRHCVCKSFFEKGSPQKSLHIRVSIIYVRNDMFPNLVEVGVFEWNLDRESCYCKATFGLFSLPCYRCTKRNATHAWSAKSSLQRMCHLKKSHEWSCWRHNGLGENSAVKATYINYIPMPGNWHLRWWHDFWWGGCILNICIWIYNYIYICIYVCVILIYIYMLVYI